VGKYFEIIRIIATTIMRCGISNYAKFFF